MFFTTRAAAFGAALLALAAPAHAATVATGGTGSLGAGGITFLGGGATTDWVGEPGVWDHTATTPASYWVRLDGTASTFVFDFDLTGYDLSTVSVDLKWAVDNTGVVNLNGVFKALVGAGNYTALSSLLIVGPGDFIAGANTLSFDATGDGTTDGFRAAVTVTAELSDVPVPGALPLLLGGVAAIGLARRKTRA